MGDVRLARPAVPALGETRVLRIWLGLGSETADALPMVGPLPRIPDAYAIGCVHSGYTSAPCMGRLLADLILGREPEMPLFDPARLAEARSGETMENTPWSPAQFGRSAASTSPP